MLVPEKNIKGFNILELIVVLAIIGVISALAYPQFSSWKKGREVRTDALKVKKVFEGINAQVQRGQFAFVQVLIGVNDDKKVVGIENDGLDEDEDKYARTIHTFIADCLGSSAAANVDISFEKIQEKVVCLVKCQKGGSPTYLKFKGKEEQVFVRYGSITRSPPPSEWDRIIKERF